MARWCGHLVWWQYKRRWHTWGKAKWISPKWTLRPWVSNRHQTLLLISNQFLNFSPFFPPILKANHPLLLGWLPFGAFIPLHLLSRGRFSHVPSLFPHQTIWLYAPEWSRSSGSFCPTPSRDESGTHCQASCGNQVWHSHLLRSQNLESSIWILSLNKMPECRCEAGTRSELCSTQGDISQTAPNCCRARLNPYTVEWPCFICIPCSAPLLCHRSISSSLDGLWGISGERQQKTARKIIVGEGVDGALEVLVWESSSFRAPGYWVVDQYC